MTDYVKSTNFTSKDSLSTGNPLKIVKGAEFDTEFNAIATAIASKADTSSPALTGTPTAPTASAGTSTGQIATTSFVGTAVSAAVITGEMKMWPTTSAPAGYLLCDGSAVSRTTYSALYAVVGTTFGSGDGSTTFNLPNFKNRMPIGSGDLYVNGNTGGSKDAVVVSHTHTASTSITESAHRHSWLGFPTGTGGTFGAVPGGISGQQGHQYTDYSDQERYTSSATTGATASTTVNSTGSSGTNANLPPYLAVNFIIKT